MRGHLEAIGLSEHHPGIYEKYIKRTLDLVLSFGGLVVLSPLYTAISLAIVIDDPGPVLFIQKRMGENKKYFKLHKFRSMKCLLLMMSQLICWRIRNSILQK